MSKEKPPFQEATEKNVGKVAKKPKPKEYSDPGGGAMVLKGGG